MVSIGLFHCIYFPKSNWIACFDSTGDKSTSGKSHHDLVKDAEKLYSELVGKKKTTEEVCKSDVLSAIHACLIKEQNKCKAASRTSSLWLQFMEMMDILRTFIRAERTANWELHLQAIQKMLPYFAASGHNLYTKSAYLYLQSMQSLKTNDPEVHQAFASGFHVVRRSNRFWAGLSTDLIIEQVLMRSIKTTGGLTRGSGMTEKQRLIWLLSTPACAQTSFAMQELAGVACEHSEQNKDMSKPRQKRDLEDTLTILNALSDGRNPFTQDASLKNIITGVNAHASVDVDKAKDKGDLSIYERYHGRNPHFQAQ